MNNPVSVYGNRRKSYTSRARAILMVLTEYGPPILLWIKDVKLLSKFYADVADVDLLVGCLLEPTVDDSMVGETTRCVLADGFYRLRYGDRFFCDVEGQPGSFTPGPRALKICSAESVDDLKRFFFCLS